MLATSSAVFSILLIITGFAKMRNPRDVERAIVAMGLPRIRFLGGWLGALEIAIGTSALVWVEIAGAQAVAYSVFAVWVLWAIRLDVPLASCGCLGRDDTPPTVAHAAMNVLAASVSIGAAFGEPLHLGAGLETVAQIAVVASGVFLAYIVLTDGARLSGVRAQ